MVYKLLGHKIWHKKYFSNIDNREFAKSDQDSYITLNTKPKKDNAYRI